MKIKNRVLLVDDDPTILQLISDIFSSTNEYDLMSVTSGEEALEKFHDFVPDLLLLDIQLPGMNGYTVCQKIRADRSLGFVKIIMISGMAQIKERLLGYEAGADDYMAKPFNADELLAKVRVFMQLKKREEVDMIKTNLLTLVTHETGTPLNGIIGCAELLLENSSLSSKDRELVRMIADSGNQLHQFMRKALLLCKLKAGFELNVYQEQLQKNLQQIINSFKKAAARKGVTFVTELTEDIILNVDWSLVVEALRLLVDNAVKFSPDGGVVKISSSRDDNFCLITIADQGAGIEPGQQDNIFTEFAIRDVSHHCQGQGISLAIVRHVVTCHNGTVTVSGERGEGTVFTVKIPLAEAQDQDG